MCGESIRVMHPLFQEGQGGSIPTSPLRASRLVFSPCDKRQAVQLVRAWHSRLSRCQDGPWQFAFVAEHDGRAYAVALWHNPSGRCLPSHWLELRRLACSPDAPKNTASRFLSWMIRWFKKHCPDRERAISYQDLAVHTGTIYKAAGWIRTARTVERIRDRSKPRIGTDRAYRSNLNGIDVDAGAKQRWEIPLMVEKCFACGKPIKSVKPCVAQVVGESTTVYVGKDCYAKIVKAGEKGFQPPRGGPRLKKASTNEQPA